MCNKKVVLALSACLGLFAHGALVINEVCYDSTNLADENGDKTSDWIEIYNNGTTATNVYNCAVSDKYDLVGFPSTGGYDETKGVRLPNYWLPPGGFLLVYASVDLPEYTAWTNAPNHSLIPSNSVWRYLSPASAPAATWPNTTFSDAAWTAGQSPLGYNDPKQNLDCATVLDYGGNPASRHTAAYFRNTFLVHKPSTVTGLVMNARLNDGAVVYLNGREVLRHNMPAGAVGHDTLASASLPSTLWTSAVLPTNGLLQGTNVVAVEVHPSSAASPDLTLDLSLTALVNEQTPIVHGQFGLSKLGEKVHLFNSSLVRVHEFAAPLTEIGENNSYGLTVDGVKASALKVFTRTTPGRSNMANSTKYLETLAAEKPAFSAPPGAYAANQSVVISTPTAGLKIYYTLDGSDPRDSSTFIYSGSSLTVSNLTPATAGIAWIRTNPVEISNSVPAAAWCPPIGGVSQATVLRTIAVSVDNTQCSPEAWGSYLIGPAFTNRTLPVISLMANANDLFGFTNGIYVPGKTYANSPVGYGTNRWGKPYANYHLDSDGVSWERRINFELFESAQTTAAVAQVLGTSMHGGGTRAIPQKTLYMMARAAEYGADRLNYKLFPDEAATSYKRFLLRNSGNDWYGPDAGVATMMKDATFHRISRSLDISLMAYRPTVTYLNGQYWGINNLRESYDKHYLATRYGLEPDNVDILMHEEDPLNEAKVVITRIDGDKAADEDYETMIGWISSNALSVAANFQQVQAWVDVTNLADYVVAETFFANTDWPINNCDFWRAHTNQVAACGKYGDTRWRWMLYDLDVAGEQGSDFDMFDYLSDKDMTDVREPGFLVNKLWKYMPYRNYFVTRYANLLNTTFKPARTETLITEAAQAIAPEIETHFRRWGRAHTRDQWQQAVNSALVQYTAERHDALWGHLDEHFNLGGTGQFTVRNSDPGGTGGHFVVNGMPIEPTTDGVTNRASWAGTYFRSLAASVQAVPDPGYLFAGWEGIASAGATLSVFVTATPQTLVARFLPEGSVGCTVLFDAQGGTVDPTNKFVAVGGAYGMLPLPTRGGHAFEGWWTEPGGAGTQVFSTTTVTGLDDRTLYAKWALAAYTVTFDAQGGTVDPANTSVTYSATYGTLPTPSRTGYAFGGWWTEAGGAGSQVIDTTPVTITADQTLYAKWTANEYTVTFDAQSGAVDPASTSVTFDAPYGELPTPARSGYTFGGWRTEPGGAGTLITAGSTVALTAAQTLYASWAANAYTVTFNPQGGAVDPGSTSVTFASSYGELPAPVRDGYTFDGWWTGADGAGAHVTALTAVATASDHTLYALWTVIVKGSASRAVADKTVTLTVTPAWGTAAWTCEETLPDGLKPLGLAGHNVSWDRASRTITWSGTNAAVATLRYSVLGRAGTYTLAGAATFDDTGDVIAGDSLLTIAQTAAWTGWRYPRADQAGLAAAAESTAVPVTATLTTLFTATGTVSEALLTGDVDGDGTLELVATAGSELRLYRGDGTVKRTVALPRPCFPALLEDVDGDGTLDIGLGSGGAGFAAYLYKGDGTLLKTFAGQHANGTNVTVAPIGLTGPTLLLGYNPTRTNALPRGVAAFDYVSATESWYYPVGPTNGNAFSVADLDGDGSLDVTMRSAAVNKGASGSGTTDGDMYLVVVDEAGAPKLSQVYPAPGDGVADHLFADLDGDGACEILGFEGHDAAANKGASQIHVYGTNGATRATYNGPDNAGWAFAVGDVGGDSGLEIVATTTSGEKTVILDRALNKLLEKSAVGFVKLLCDLTGDGVPEIVTLSNTGLLRVLDVRLNVVASVQAGTRQGTVIASDINADGVVELACRTDKLYVFGFRKLALPRVNTFALDAGKASTADRVVTLNNACSNAPTHYMASESPTFDGAAWQVYAAAPLFALSDGAGAKAVYFKVKNQAGESPVVSDTLSQPQAKPVVTTLALNAGAAGTNRRTVTLNNDCTGVPTQYQASASSTFDGGAAPWQTYGTAPTFELPVGKGTKTVYFRVRNALGTSATKTDTISLDETAVQVTATADPAAGGTVTPAVGLIYPGKPLALTAKAATGWVFTGWENGSKALARSVAVAEDGNADGQVEVTASFKPLTELAYPSIVNPGTRFATVGVAFALPLTVSSESAPTVTVTGLPTGLKLDAARLSIVGVPTKAGLFTVMVAATNAKGAALPQAFYVVIDALPAWAQGTFNGTAGTDELGAGVASLTVSALGAVSGKITLRGSNYTFSAASYASLDEDDTFRLTSTAKVGVVAFPLTLAVSAPPAAQSNVLAVAVPATLGKADGELGGDGWLTLYRNVWKDAGMTTVLTNGFSGYFTASLPGGSDFGSGYLTFTVDAAGGVKTVGKLADGTAVSLSGTLVLDEDGRVWTVIYTAPAAYKGGGLFGVVEWLKPADGVPAVVQTLASPFDWTSLNPLSTSDVEAAGFSWSLQLVGGWYAKVGNLYDYYRDKALSASVDGGAPAPALWVGASRYESAWWDPNGLTILAVTNNLGVMTGLSAPKIGTPVKDGADYIYDSVTNAVGLTIALARPTGIFTGSFKAWFDYDATHTSKSFPYEGVLTPVRASGEAEGRGYFLSSDKATYENALGATITYSFNWSYDFLLLAE